MSKTRYAVILVVLAAVSGGGLGVGLAAMRRHRTSGRVYDSRVSHAFTATRRIGLAPQAVDSISVTGHGGTAEIEWYCGAWSSLSARGSSAVSLLLDGRPLADAVLGGPGGKWNARPAVLRWMGRLAPGRHVVSVRLERAVGVTALPLVVDHVPVVEGLDVTEHAG